MTSISATAARRAFGAAAPAVLLAAVLAGCGDGASESVPRLEQAGPLTLVQEGECAVDLSVTPPDLTVYGADAGDFLADRFSLATGDFNDDGLGDVLVGAPLADGPENERENAGEAYVIFGQADPPAVIDLATYAAFTVVGAEAGDNLGFTVAAGDVNGDGADDIVAGARFAGADGRTNAGAVYVIYGGTSVFASPSLAGPLDLAASTADATVIGPHTGALLSIALATGDVDGDDIDDLLIGASGTDGPDALRDGAGSVVVVRGSTSLPETTDLGSEEAAMTVHGETAGDSLPNHLAAGDLDGDGRYELIIGAPFADTPDREDAGKTYVIPFDGGTVDLADSDVVTITGGERKDALGFEVAAGDLNGDGTDDLITGARDADGPDDSINNGGEIHVMFGGGSLPRSVDLREAPSDMMVHSTNPGDSAGFAVAAADINLDGLDDIIAGVPLADGCDNAKPDAGDVYVVFGRAEPVPATIALSNAGDLSYFGTVDGDATGFSVGATDFNGDGRQDVIIGELQSDGPEGDRPDAGALYIVLQEAM